MVMPQLTALFEDDTLPSADELNAKLVNPINWLLAMSGVSGFDLTPLGRDNGRGRLVLPYQGATGKPIAIMFDRAAGTDGEGAIILFNDEGALAVNTEDGTVHPLQVDELTFPAGTTAGSILYSTANPAPANPTRFALGLLPPAAGVLTSGASGPPAWDSGYHPAGVTFQREWAFADNDDTEVVDVWTHSVTGNFIAGQDIAITPPMPWPGTVGIQLVVTFTADGRIQPYSEGQRITENTPRWDFVAPSPRTTFTFGSGGVNQPVSVSQGQQITFRVESGVVTRVDFTIRAKAVAYPEPLV